MDARALSDAAWSIWAKSDRDTDSSLALHRHLTDSAAIAELLWDEWLPVQTKRVLSEAVGDADDARDVAVWLAGTHDIGKATPEFTKQVDLLTGRMREVGLAFPVSTVTTPRIPHSVMGYEIVRRRLHESGYSNASAASLAIVAGGHHGTPPNRSDLALLGRHPHALGDVPLWSRVRTELLDFITDFVGAESALDRLRDRPIPVTAQVLFTAFVIIADWIASNTDYFPYDNTGDSRARALAAWTRLGLPPGWSASRNDGDADELLRARFALGHDARARPVQTTAVEAARRLGSGLLIIEAPMGEGKTEAALLAAEVFASATGAGGCIVALPTMATSDAMFSRVLSWVERLPDSRGVSQPQSAFLAHSKKDLNRDFGRLRRIRAVGDDQRGAHRLSETVIEAHQWLGGRKKGTLSNFVVGTIDQVLFGALKSKHVVLRHLALANKVVIIDEVHAADVYMSVYLERILAWLGAYGIPVVLLSATLAPSSRVRLAAAYASLSDKDAAPIEANTGYPSITSVRAADGAVTVDEVPGSPRSVEISIERLGDDDEALIERLRGPVTAGAAIAVIRNTVARAQRTAQLLRAEFGTDAVLLAHSRFIATDRIEIESALRDRLGPPTMSAGEDAPRHARGPLIVIGTQVLEQSLDIDFDLMVTDVAPVDLLLQRAGRLHRHDRPTRPLGCSTPVLVLTGVDDWNAQPPSFDSGSSAIYGEHLLLRTVLSLDDLTRARATLRVPADLSDLVRTVYDGDPPAPTSWADALTTARKAWRTRRREKEKKADVFALDRPEDSNDLLVGWLEAPAIGADEDSPNAQQQVRDTEDSVEVLVALQRDGELYVLPWLPDADVPVDRVGRPSSSHAWTLATSSIRLPPQLCRWSQVDKTIGALEVNAYEGWQQSPLLKGQLVLVLDDDLTAEVGGFAVRYERLDGLTITKLDGGS